ncbi:hypothetical protein [Luteolibacter marinus]|uniref:hypothetical protein n=1 Tax=Luteolibacter marinus TaxID=2776705 RepID=UPI001867018E|nr:hypothetical protein [Luteolibacter marinus]
MAGKNDIEIGVRTTADTSGAKAAEEALEKLEDQAHETDAAMEDLAASSGSTSGKLGRPGSKGAAGALKEVTVEAPKAAAATGNAGRAVLEASRAFEDMQYGIGGVLNNIPGLVLALGGTAGIAGAASLAAVAVSLIAPKLLESLGSSGVDEALDDLQEKLDQVRQKGVEAESARSSQSLDAFAESLQREADGYRRINDELRQNIGLLQSRRRAQAEIESAQAALNLARIDADGSLSEEEKIKRRAEVQERLEQQRFQQRLAGIGDRLATADAGARTAYEEAKAKSNATTEAGQLLDDARAERDRLRPGFQASRRLPGARAAYEKALAEVRQREDDGEFKDGENLSASAKRADERLKSARERLEELEAVKVSEAELRRYLALEKTIIAEREALVAERLKEEEAAHKAAGKAAKERDRVAAEVSAETEGAVNAFELGRQTRGVTTGAAAQRAADAAAKRKADEAAREAARVAAEASQREQLGAQGEGIADQAARAIASRSERAAAQFEKLGNDLAGNPTAEAADRLGSALEKVAANLDGREQRTARQFRAMAERMERLEAKLRTSGDGK